MPPAPKQYTDSIKSNHIAAILARPGLCASLIVIEVCNTKGTPLLQLHNNILVRLAKACPKLETVKITGAANIDDSVLYAFLDNCTGWTTLQICGSCSKFGRMTGWALMAMKQNPQLGARLTSLHITNQPRKIDKAAKRLFFSRRGKLNVYIGRIKRLSMEDLY